MSQILPASLEASGLVKLTIYNVTSTQDGAPRRGQLNSLGFIFLLKKDLILEVYLV